jgi:dipeptidyl aminopeptidase/acylaminoacyl peptidase
MKGGLRTEDLERLALASDPQLSSGGVVAFVRSWLDLAGDTIRHEVVLGGAARPRLPAGPASTWCPRWSPDGTRLAVISTAGGPAQAAVWTPGSPALLALAPVPGEVTDLDWAPDGRCLAVATVTREHLAAGAAAGHPAGPARLDGVAGLARERRRVWLLAADGAPGRELTAAGDGADTWQPRWSPDGSRLAVLSAAPGGPARICTADPGQPGPASSTRLPAGAVASAWSPDGTQICCLAPRPGEFPDIECRLFVGGAAGQGEPAEIAAGWDRSLGSGVRGDDARGTGPARLLWSAATGRLYFGVADGGRGVIGWASPGTGDHGILCGGRRSCLEPGLGADGRSLVFVSTDPADPGTVRAVDLATGTESQLAGPDPWLAATPLARTEQVTARGADGALLEAWLTLPGDRQPPLVVSLHGGPHYPVGWRFSFEAQRLAARGYAVLAPNPRGSGGYGRAFATAIRGRWTLAWTDVGALIDAAIAGYALDRDRIGVTGVSYGGFLSLHAATASDRVRTAICENGISNLLALWGSGAEDPDWLTAEMGGAPWEQPGPYVRDSPLTAAAGISAPLLLIHSELDQNCPISQSEQMLAAVRRCGGEAQLLRLDGEGHLVNLTGRPSRRLARSRAVDDWLDRHLRATAGDGPGIPADADRSDHDGGS